jgi:hypothetical protein
VQPPPVFPGAWRLPPERQQKPDVSQTESAPIEQPSRLRQLIPPPVPLPAAPTFEVHKALPVELQQLPIVTPSAEAYGARKAIGVVKAADFKTDIARLLKSKSSLRELILLREILGTPRGLEGMDASL